MTMTIMVASLHMQNYVVNVRRGGVTELTVVPFMGQSINGDMIGSSVGV